jgi:hypothetical protein
MKDLKKETGVHTPGSELKDRVAYKQCVQQQKQQRSTNPWAMCNSQFGIGKSDNIPVGQSYKSMAKKESNTMRTNRGDANKIRAAEKEHMKPTHPQLPKVAPKKVHLKQPVFKSEIEPGMSFNQLKKMQTEQPLEKFNPSYPVGTTSSGKTVQAHFNHSSHSEFTSKDHHEASVMHGNQAQSAWRLHQERKKAHFKEAALHHVKQAKLHEEASKK